MFLPYFILSGTISAVISYRDYSKISKTNAVVEMVGIEGFVLLNFLVGFLNVWVVLPLKIQNYYLKKKIERTKKRIEENDQTNADINAIMIYLRMGYPIEDAKETFYSIFDKNDPKNKKRFKNVEKFIKSCKKNGR